jgi:Secretion system C-terminal sorting domain
MNIKLFMFFILLNIIQLSSINAQQSSTLDTLSDACLIEESAQPTKSLENGWQIYDPYPGAIFWVNVAKPYTYNPSDLYVAVGQTRIAFYTPIRPLAMEYRFDNGGWQSGQVVINSTYGVFTMRTPITLPWNTVGVYKIDCRWLDVSGRWQTREFTIHLSPPLSAYAADSYGNTVSMWKPFDRPFGNKTLLAIEGLDAVNETYAPEVYWVGKDLFNTLRNNVYGQNVAVFNFANGGANIVTNTEHLKSFLRFYYDRYGYESTVVAGLSMGGVIGRAALSSLESNHEYVGVSHLFSLDSPQQGAVMDQDLLLRIKIQQPHDIPHPVLASPAAKQLLQESPFATSEHTLLYNHINAINGDGYPKTTRNVGISFSNNSPSNHINSIWLTIRNTDPVRDFFYRVKDSWSQPGSFLPWKSTQIWGRVAAGLITYELFREPPGSQIQPTFIPYNSALDLVNGVSKFDVTYSNTVRGYHDQLPPALGAPIISELLDRHLKNRLIRRNRWEGTLTYTANSIFVGPNLTVLDGGDVDLLANDKIVMKPGFTVNPDANFRARVSALRGNGGGDGIELNTTIASGQGKKSVSSESVLNTSDKPKTPTDFLLGQNYPNPFNPSTVINYQLPQQTKVRLQVFDMLGRVVADLVNDVKPAGAHQATFNASSLASGTYFYRLQAGTFVQTKKMVLVK